MKLSQHMQRPIFVLSEAYLARPATTLLALIVVLPISLLYAAMAAFLAVLGLALQENGL